MTKNFETLAELVVDYKAEWFHSCFGIEEKRGQEIVKAISDTMTFIHYVKDWSPVDLLKVIADAKIAKTPRETAFVVFLIGCHCGENLSFQTTIQDALLRLTMTSKGYGGGRKGGMTVVQA